MNKDVRTKFATCVLTQKEYDKLKKYSIKNDISVSSLVRKLILKEIGR
jgi:hypothetical protein